ncbi:hypothetical protein D8O27_14705 [Burkholderia mallei]|uniref:Uncharacterized protein n=3 Tax=pseudomallei group TaxID=111527 RepID=A0AAX1XC42_BURML|nr:hypothetical protein BMAA1110 [Burkholderia mallei ATCC 23344]AUL60650.1 hypothetical protein BHT10_34440 [Burkholderia pseudomallei]RKN97091.1 hypothetical protein D8O31_15805 [Burkholderia mallei]PJO56760.1 hypothetical protein CWD85_25080 [Burkholderia pseudomallei]PJO64529.1 hypothetical protein CWD88_19885 [Burkholderia pseudomallei]
MSCAWYRGSKKDGWTRPAHPPRAAASRMNRAGAQAGARRFPSFVARPAGRARRSPGRPKRIRHLIGTPDDGGAKRETLRMINAMHRDGVDVFTYSHVRREGETAWVRVSFRIVQNV